MISTSVSFKDGKVTTITTIDTSMLPFDTIEHFMALANTNTTVTEHTDKLVIKTVEEVQRVAGFDTYTISK